MSYINQAKLATDTTFRLLVQLGMAVAATAIAGEAKGAMTDAVYGKRQELAKDVLANNAKHIDKFAWAVAQNGAIVTGSPVAITASTSANPTVVTTAAAHGLSTGDTVLIANHTTNTVANGAWTVTVLTSTTFSIPAAGIGVGAGGTVTKYPIDNDIAFQISASWNDLAGITGTD